MSKILLINPPLRTWSPNIHVPLGLAYIAAPLEEKGHDVAILDMNLYNINYSRLRKYLHGVDIVGITGMITEYREIQDIAASVKNISGKVKIIIGGPMASAIPDRLFDNPLFNYIVVGEGEQITPGIVAAILGGFNTRGLAGCDKIEDIDSIPYPTHHLLDMGQYSNKHFEAYGIRLNGFGRMKSTTMITSRGCPYSCTFCFKGLWGNKWRARSPENIIGEMESLIDGYGINGFIFTDDTFVLDKNRVYEFCDLLQRKKLNVAWYCNGRANLMSKEMLMVMYAAGCRGIAYGIESGNQKMLDSMNKVERLEDVRQAVVWTKAAGIHVTGYFIIGMPGECKATIQATFKFARELGLDFSGFSLAMPIPGTALYDEAVKAGAISGDDFDMDEWTLKAGVNLTEDCTDKELVGYASAAFKEFYIRKRFGKAYILNPRLWIEVLRVMAGLRNRVRATELLKKSIRLFNAGGRLC